MGKSHANTIEALENNFWSEPEYPSYLVTTCHSLRKKDLDLFENEDYRILIGQNIALEILMLRALKILQENIFAEGALFEGDLLKMVLVSDKEFWNKHLIIKEEMIRLFEHNLIDLRNKEALLSIDKHILEKFELFKA